MLGGNDKEDLRIGGSGVAVPGDGKLAPLGYEQARDELTEVVRRLEAGGASLEESLTLWERGEELAAICQQRLDGARERLARATEKSGDAVGGSS